MEVSRTKLIEVLKAIEPGLAKKEIVEQETDFVFLKDKIGANNNRVCILCPFKTGIKGVVKAKELMLLLSKHKAEKLNFEVDNNELIVSTKTSKAGISLNQDIKISLDNFEKPSKWKKLPNNFISNLSLISSSTSQDISEPIFTHIHIKDGYMEATDKFKYTRCPVAIKDEFLISNIIIEHIIKYPLVGYSITKNWIHFIDKNKVVFSIKSMEGKYPDLSFLFDGMNKAIKILIPEKAKEIIEKARVFTKNAIDEELVVKIKDNILLFTSKGEYGWFKEGIKTKSQGNISFRINPTLLQESLNFSSTYKATNEKIMIENKNFVHIIALMKG